MTTNTDIRQGGPGVTVNTGPDPYPPQDNDNKAALTGWGWELMIRRIRRTATWRV